MINVCSTFSLNKLKNQKLSEQIILAFDPLVRGKYSVYTCTLLYRNLLIFWVGVFSKGSL